MQPRRHDTDPIYNVRDCCQAFTLQYKIQDHHSTNCNRGNDSAGQASVFEMDGAQLVADMLREE